MGLFSVFVCLPASPLYHANHSLPAGVYADVLNGNRLMVRLTTIATQRIEQNRKLRDNRLA